jgi:signal transduction histidine kinase
MAGLNLLGIRPLDLLSIAAATACLTLAGLHFVIWSRNRSAPANLWFAVLATGMAVFTWFALAMMRADTPVQFIAAIRWLNVSIFAMVVAIVCFVGAYFDTTRPWLGHLAWGIRLVTLVVNFARPVGMDYDRVDAIVPIPFLGDTVSVPVGATSIWHWIGQVSFVFLLCHVLDASRTLWNVGTAEDRRRVRVVGLPLSAFVFGGPVYAALVFRKVIQLPHIEFVPFLGILGAMSYELCRDVLRSAQLARELQSSEAALSDSEQRMTMAADAARLGMWMWDIATGEIWLTEKCRELFAFAPRAVVDYEAFVGRLHPDDRETREGAIRDAIAAGTQYKTDYRVLLPDGRQRWISSHGRVDVDADRRPERMLGVCIDITEQRNAELAARELGGRLINAQEDERRRIARDLHDDLNQRLALLSVELELLGHARPDSNPGAHAEELASQVRELSSDVHRLSYRLHPAKLDQLGLVTAARSWCRDVTQQSAVRVEFVSQDVPDDLSADVALCLFRIVQEALRNVVRHSGATAARVELFGNTKEIHLDVTDTGRGFDPALIATGRGLGLLSMQERVRLVNGTIEVHSAPGVGTKVIAVIPWAGANTGTAGLQAPAATSL